MQFGVQFFPNFRPSDKSAAEYFAQSLAVAEEAETLGYTHARSVEHYFERYGGYSPNPIVFLAAAAARTKKMRLVTGAVVPAFNNPLKLAGEIAMLDAISGGRFDVGFARAFLPHEFRRFNISPDTSVARFREGLEQIELLLTQENVTHRGQFHSFENVTSLPRPTQKPRPKFYIASTRTADSFEFAGRAGHALMSIPIGPLKDLMPIYRKAWRDAGHPGDGEVMIAFHMFCHEDAKLAREIPRRQFEDYFVALYRIRRRMDARHVVEGLQRLRRFDQPDEEFHAGNPDRKPAAPGSARRTRSKPSSAASEGASANSSTPRCRSISARSIRRSAKIDAAVRQGRDTGVFLKTWIKAWPDH